MSIILALEQRNALGAASMCPVGRNVYGVDMLLDCV